MFAGGGDGLGAYAIVEIIFGTEPTIDYDYDYGSDYGYDYGYGQYWTATIEGFALKWPKSQQRRLASLSHGSEGAVTTKLRSRRATARASAHRG